MIPIAGWYRRSDWIKTFRPDGKGHIKIIVNGEAVEDIEVEDLVCDLCNADMAARLLEEVNEHRLAKVLFDSLSEKPPEGDKP